LGLLLLQAGLLGGAYAGGRYPEWKKRHAFEESTRLEKEKQEENIRRTILTTRARSMLMEAALAVQYHNHGMAFERVIRAQGAAQNLKLPLQKEFDEISMLLIAQKPEAMDKILQLADKVEPPQPFGPPSLSGPAKPAVAMMQAAGQAAPPTAGGTPTAAVPAPAGQRPAAATEGAPRPAAPSAALPPAAAMPPMPRARLETGTESVVEQGRSALLAAKELLIAGGEAGTIIGKLAHAQVVLEEGGHQEFSEQLTAAIKAVRAHDEQKARSALDGVLTSLRSL
jgi:hypothetical protein